MAGEAKLSFDLAGLRQAYWSLNFRIKLKFDFNLGYSCDLARGKNVTGVFYKVFSMKNWSSG